MNIPASSAAPLHIYVHWPWCQSKCPYCDFNSHAMPNNGLGFDTRQNYLTALQAELIWWKSQLADNRPIKSVFFGGGTPSLLKPSEIHNILQTIQKLGLWHADTEVTLECNPGSILEHIQDDYFGQIRAAGINRVSIGVQGLQDNGLKFLGRSHNTRDALNTLEAGLHANLRVNADVIYGIPEQSLIAWQQQLSRLASMGLHHIAAYQLTIEPNTAFWGQVQRGAWLPVDSDTEADFFSCTKSTLEAHGYENYEISNFAKAHEACRHNLGVWQGEDYLGIGAGAHGGLHLVSGEFVRTATRKQPEHYLKATLRIEGRSGFAQWFAPSPAQQVQDAFFTGLRLKDGVALGRLKKTYGDTLIYSAIDATVLQLFIQQNWLQTTGKGYTEHLCLTARGWPLMSGLLKELFISL